MATTINSYSVSLALDAKDYIKNSALSRSETSSLTRQINQARTPADKYERSVKLLDKALKNGTISQQTYTKLLNAQSMALDKAATKTSTMVGHVKRLALAYISMRALTSGVGGGIKLAADAEDAQIQFRVLLKSAEDAEKLLGQIKQFAAATPFQFPELRQAGQLLLAFGFSGQEVVGTLQMLGNVSAATGSRIGELAELLGKAKTQNTIYSEDLNQLTGRGINVLDKLAARFGITAAEVKKFASEGKIQFADLQAVMTDLSENDFAGLMLEKSKGLNGQWSTLKDNLASIQQSLGEGLLPLMNKLAAKGTEWARSFKTGMDVLNEGKDAQAIQQEADARIAASNAEIEWMKKQVELRRQGKDTMRTAGSIAASAKGVDAASLGSLDPLGFGKGVAEGLAGGMGGIADHFGGMFQQLGNTVIWSNDVASEKVKKAVTEDPAIASLEAGTQEAYAFLTQGMKEAESAQKLLIQEQKKADAEARKQRENQYTVLNKIHDVLSANGWAKARQ